MSFPATVFRVLIASPSDVAEEREIVVKAIQEWNDLNSFQRQVVVLPLRWETHAAPEYNSRPQAVINRQVVDHCDMLVGVFWARIGSHTGVSEGGTIEEIERVAAAQKPVMLYFSKAKHDIEAIDLEQLARLRDFKRKTVPNAYIETYSTHVEFKDKVIRQLEMQLRSLISNAGDSSRSVQIAEPVTDIQLRFADIASGVDFGSILNIDSRYFDVEQEDDLPDYVGETKDKIKLSDLVNLKEAGVLASQGGKPNRNYYRQAVAYEILQGFFRPIRFWLKNVGGVGARDVHIDLEISSDNGGLAVVHKNALPSQPPSKSDAGYSSLLFSGSYVNSSRDLLSRVASYWTVPLDIPALQPQRAIAPIPEFLIGSTSSCQVVVEATIFADTLSQPVKQILKINFNVEVSRIKATSLLPDFVFGDPSKG